MSSLSSTPQARARAGAGILIVAALLLGVSTVSAPSALGADNVPSHVVNANSAKLLDVRGASHDNGAQIIQWKANGGANQVWTFKPVGPPIGGTLQLYLIQSQDSKKVLDVQGGSKNDGVSVVQNDWTGAISQLWIVFQFGDTAYSFIMNVNSAKVLDVAASSKDDGASVIQWPWQAGVNQLWSILDLGP